MLSSRRLIGPLSQEGLAYETRSEMKKSVSSFKRNGYRHHPVLAVARIPVEQI
jgi:hypothetical protein